VAFGPQANNTDRSTATCRRNLVPTFVDRGVSLGQRQGNCMKPEGLLPCLQEPSTLVYPRLGHTSRSSLSLSEIHLNVFTDLLMESLLALPSITYTCSSSPPGFTMLIILDRVMKLLIMLLSPPFCRFIYPCPNIFVSTLFSVCLHPSLNDRDHVSQQYKTKSKLTVLHIQIFKLIITYTGISFLNVTIFRDIALQLVLD
jgi:hypothetical protein